MTIELFRNDSYLDKCNSKVLDILNEGLVLDKTIFYPEGGGQPGDIGIIKSIKTNFVITGTKYINKKIVHFVEEKNKFSIGQEVKIFLDWRRRYKIMRVHTALHLLCSIIDAPVTGGQINENKGRLDFDLESKPDKEYVLTKINELIKKNYDVEISYISEKELDKKPELVRTMSVKPPRGFGRIRMIKIGNDVDYQPCGGTHVKSTSEIAKVNSVKVDNKGKMNKRVIISFD